MRIPETQSLPKIYLAITLFISVFIYIALERNLWHRLIRVRAIVGEDAISQFPLVDLSGEKNQRIQRMEDNEEEFHDQTFAPLLSLFLKKTTGKLNPSIKSFKSGSVPRVLLWAKPFETPFWQAQTSDISSGLCPLPCEVTYNPRLIETADAVVIYLRCAKDVSFVNKYLFPRNPNQPWIMLTFEAPPLANSVYKSNYSNFNGFFNRTMMYRQDADIIVPHGFIVRRGLVAKTLPPEWVLETPPTPSVEDIRNNSKKLAVTFISHCVKHRSQYIREVNRYAPVDVYGKCGTLKCGKSMYVGQKYNITQDDCMKKAGENYLFYFAFENSFCTDYVTEKAYNLLYYPIVPIFRGSMNYSKIFPPNSYIDATHYTPQQLAEKMLYLQENLEEYMKYLDWRKYYQPSTIGGERTMCHLCARLHDKDFYEHNVIEDFNDWFKTKSKC